MRTTEYVKGGVKISPVARFVDFRNMSEAVRFYASLVFRLYPRAAESRHNPLFYFEGLVSGRWKWATDPDYAMKLRRLYFQMQMDKKFQDVLKPRFKEFILVVGDEKAQGPALCDLAVAKR